MCLGSLLAVLLGSLSSSPSHPAPARHCQVPCGIYGDKMRIDLLMEDAATIEKGMKRIRELETGKVLGRNQLVRWIMNKDQHAASIQEMVASYWLAQRIKTPRSPGDDAAWASYRTQLQLMHEIIVAAMKCKQTVDATWVATLRSKAMAFSRTYFKPDDLKHLEEHHGRHQK